VDDYDAICQLLKVASEGEARGDLAKLKEAWHPGARVFASMPNGTYDRSAEEWMPQRASDPADAGAYRWRVLAVQQTGDVAVATVAEEGYTGGHLGRGFLNYFLLGRIHGIWKIVGGAAQQY
jgi:hypothetical protein